MIPLLFMHVLLNHSSADKTKCRLFDNFILFRFIVPYMLDGHR